MQITNYDPRVLLKNPWNSNSVSPDNMRRLEASLEKHGWVRPVLVRTLPDGNREILGGQHRVEAAINLHFAEVPVVDLGLVDDDRAMELGLIDNARYGMDDASQLAEILSHLGTTTDIGEILPFSTEELAALGQGVEIDFDTLSSGSEEIGLPDVPPKSRPIKTHTVLRFKIPVGDVDKIEEVITQITKAKGFTDSDTLTNAGDALIWLANNATYDLE